MPRCPASGLALAKTKIEPRFGGVGDPELAAGDAVVIAVLRRRASPARRRPIRRRLPTARTKPRCRAPASAGSGASVRRCPSADQDVVGDGVLHVDDDGGGRVHFGQCFHREHGLEEIAALAAVFLGDLDAHQAELEHFVEQVFAENAGCVHLADVRRDALPGESPDGGLKHLLFFVQNGERLDRKVSNFGRGSHSLFSLFSQSTTGADSESGGSFQGV